MDVEFINEFLSVQRKTIEDLMSEILMLRTQKNITESKLKAAIEKVENLEKQLAKVSKKGTE